MAPATAAACSPAKKMTVARAVYRVQLALLDGAAASNKPLLHAASAVLSRSDYDDVVTERHISDACGHPVCTTSLPENAANSKTAPRFHISLREHRVYDLEEARKFCSERCLVASAAFAASLPSDRPFGVPPDRLDALVALFEGGGDGSGLGFRVDGAKKDEGTKVEIREKETPGPGEVTLQEWIGPSAAIEGYVPRRDRIGEGPMPEAKQSKVGRTEQSSHKNVDSRNAAPGEDGRVISASSVEAQVNSDVIAKKLDDMILRDNTETKKKEAAITLSQIFQQDEDKDMLSSCITDSIAKQLDDVVLEEKKDGKKKKSTRATSKASKTKPAKRAAGSDGHDMGFTSTIIIGDHASAMMDQGPVGQYNFSSSIMVDNRPSSSQYEELSNAVNLGKDESSDEKVKHALRSSLKAVGSKNRRQSVTWADENASVLEIGKASESQSIDTKQSKEEVDSSPRRASAEACAAALIEAAETISSGTSEVEDAVAKAGIIILPDMLHQKQFENEKENESEKETMENDIFEIDSGVVKWPKKTVLLDTDMFEVDDSWHDTPPEGFSLTLSAFATMWAALFGWISRSSLAYVYMLDESSVEELLISSGIEYPQKIVSKDGQSSEIKRALATCICQALPVRVSNMKMQIPVSKLETTLGYLMDTMSFIEALPPLRSRQWQVMVLVLLDALSIHRLPAIAPVMSDSKLIQKFLKSAQVSRDEYDVMVNLFLPFGRSMQSQTPLQS